MSIRDFPKKKGGGGGCLENIFSSKGGPGRKSLGTTVLSNLTFGCFRMFLGVQCSIQNEAYKGQSNFQEGMRVEINTCFSGSKFPFEEGVTIVFVDV